MERRMTEGQTLPEIRIQSVESIRKPGTFLAFYAVGEVAPQEFIEELEDYLHGTEYKAPPVAAVYTTHWRLSKRTSRGGQRRIFGCFAGDEGAFPVTAVDVRHWRR